MTMDEPTNTSTQTDAQPAADAHLPAQPPRSRLLGVVLRDDSRTKGFIFLTTGDSIEYFAHKTGFDPASLFWSISPGKPVSFSSRWTMKGHRAFDIREATTAEAAEIAELIEDRLAASRAAEVREQELKGDDRGNR
jgi:hypothetical protein